MLAIVGASGKLGLATLTALLDHHLLPPSQILCTASSESGLQKLLPAREKGVQIAQAHWDSPSSFEAALAGSDKLFLISSSRIAKDFFDAAPGEGREADHFVALEAARKVGVRRVYYTSLAFGDSSRSCVMRAHERTEEWLGSQAGEGGMEWTVLREGLYSESWPLYLGHSLVRGDGREVVPVAGDGKVSWTCIADLGFASALVLAQEGEEWVGRTCYLAQERAYTIREVAAMVSKAKVKEVRLKIVSREEHEEYYVQQRGMEEGYVKWWAKTYDALKDGECEIHDGTLEKLLASKGRKPEQMEDTVARMLKA